MTETPDESLANPSLQFEIDETEIAPVPTALAVLWTLMYVPVPRVPF